MSLYSIKELNKRLAENIAALVEETECAYEKKILDAAIKIRDRSEDCPIVLLSGPSGSGKTTTALRIEKLLDSWGYETHTLSMDNYFYSCTEGNMPLDDDGKIDLESPLRLDVSLLAEHMEQIARCKPIDVPTFDFANQCRSKITIPLHRHKGELVILEGIHSLNPEVTGSAVDFSTGVYVSVRTRIQADNGEILHPEKIRLCRRLLRDSLYRGQSFETTISRLSSVSRGERLYILPHKNRAEISIDTFLPYEMAVYSSELAQGMAKVEDAFLAQYGVEELKAFLLQTSPMSKDLVPQNSLIREFIGDLEL